MKTEPDFQHTATHALTERVLGLREPGREAALYTSVPARAKAAADRFDRVYFGYEFTMDRLPDARRACAAMAACLERGRGFTLVTPLLTDRGVGRARRLLRALAAQQAPFEVVVSDMGLFRVAREFENVTPVAGRLVVRQKSDPRLNLVRNRARKEYFKRTAADSAEFAALLRENGVARVELDNPLHGVALPEGFASSLYTPFVFVTLSTWRREQMADEDRVFVLENPGLPVKLLLRGGAQFYENDAPAATRLRGVSRIVLQAEVPL